jgi:hypothetical protein
MVTTAPYPFSSWNGAVKSSGAALTGVEAVPNGFTTYFELPTGEKLQPLLVAVSQAEVRAKIRTGGVKASMFRDTDAIEGLRARFRL